MPTGAAVMVSQSYRVDDPSVLGAKTGVTAVPSSTIDAGDLQVPLSVPAPAAAPGAGSSSPVKLPPPTSMAASVQVSPVQPKVAVPVAHSTVVSSSESSGAQGLPLAPPPDSAAAAKVEVAPPQPASAVHEVSQGPVPAGVEASESSASAPVVITSSTYQTLGVQVTAKVESDTTFVAQPLAAVPKVDKPVTAVLNTAEVVRQVSFMDSQLDGGVDSPVR